MKNIKKIYFSPTGNTKKIVDAVSTGMGEESTAIDITLPLARAEGYSFSDEDILVLGVPVYGGRVPRFLSEFIKKLNGNQSKAIAIVTYGNRDYEDSLLELCAMLTDQGFTIEAAGAFVGEHSSTELLATGRPNEDDIKLATDFGKKIASCDSTEKIIVKGNFPYVDKQSPLPPMTPDTNDSCVQCKICAKTCPTAAISMDNCKEITLEKCIKCRSCVKKCPKNAKEFTHPGYKKMQEMLVQNFAKQQKNPEFFFAK